MTELQFDQFSNHGLRPQSIAHASGTIRLPGYGLPLNYLPDKRDRFPVLMEDTNKSWKASTLLIREVCMLKFMEDITNKPEWWRKVRDPVISAKWKKEVQTLDWAAYRSHGDFTKNMAEACMQELRKKAALYEETGLIPALDYSTCVIKSDKLLPSSLVDRLKVAVKSLEDIPDVAKDWHPGSDGKVLDLVHPSLFPLLYGRSRIMHQRITLDNCLEIGGPGFLIPKPDESDVGEGRTFDWQGAPIELVSTKFQWLPSDVAINEDGRTTIESYVNNLHPREHSDLYPLIEELIQKSLPAWDIIYRWVRKFPVQRLRARKVGKRVAIPDAVPEQGNQLDGNENDVPMDMPECHRLEVDDLVQPTAAIGEKIGRQRGDAHESKRLKSDDAASEDDEHDDEDCDESDDEEDYDYDYDDDDDDSDSEDEQVREPSSYFRLSPKNIKQAGFFNNAPRIQVIVKLANIHLTPEKPTYDGGSWHIEGQLNEHICATALFYYDSANITESLLAFRAPGNREKLDQRLNYQQYDHKSIEKVFAIRSSSDTLQEVGSVLTRPGRTLFFSNLSQHRVRPFRLEDPTKPGYRKIVALFLVDPAVPVISTANVPPQQKHWFEGKDQVHGANDMVETMSALIEMDEAKKMREELMKERTVLSKTVNDELRDVEWSFCEH
ncbi:uncharacterized protein CCOS01_09017 [Colletotrichum costaricense]|uniref:Duf1665 domain containing protein n=1 Tax=Colletotrichum costaricense TaxID=1209916 RepID=A0AAI9YTJ5_9PEZI|nr:uncharacterized protein CCOS01_09017 [Colletotrichum costaricense]KAK1523930.1 hypothetical protein CCOS01_09017 [Colletotrichum costaricense]